MQVNSPHDGFGGFFGDNPEFLQGILAEYNQNNQILGDLQENYEIALQIHIIRHEDLSVPAAVISGAIEGLVGTVEGAAELIELAADPEMALEIIEVIAENPELLPQAILEPYQMRLEAGDVAGALGYAIPGLVATVGSTVAIIRGIRGGSLAAPNRTLDFDNAATTTVSGHVDPSDIRFSQNNISQNFRDGSSVDDLVTGLRNGTVDPNSVPSIRVFEVDGQLVTLDNRRLYAYQQAGIPIRVEPATPAQIRNESFKFTTENGSTDIDVRGR